MSRAWRIEHTGALYPGGCGTMMKSCSNSMVLTVKQTARELTFDVMSERRSAAHGCWGQISAGFCRPTVRICWGHRIGTGPAAYRILETLEKQYPILVTSANHMPRAVAAFRKAGMQPIPAPTEYLTRDDYGFLGYLPTLKHLMCVNSLQAGKNLSLCPSCSTVDQKKEQGSN